MDVQFIKFFKRFLAFIFIGAFIYSVLICVWGYCIPDKYCKNLNFKIGSSYIRFQEVKKYKNIDILFAGSSHAYRGFDPRIFEKAGYSSFNLGSTAQTPLQTEYLLEQYIEKLNPRIVVMEVYPKVFTIDGVESTLDILSNNFDVNRLSLTLEYMNFKVLNTFIYSTFFKYFEFDDYQNEHILSSNNTYIIGGYVEKKMSYNKMRPYKPLNLSFVDKQYKFLKKINKMVRDQGSVPIFVMAPIDKKLYKSFLNVNEIIEKIKNLGVFYNFNELMHLNDTLHFYDSHHLNQRGVELFNNELIKILNSVEK